MSTSINSDIIRIVDDANDWLRKSALPIWFDKGVDWSGGGVFEFLTTDGHACDADYKRVRVLTRQIYVFCAACTLGETYVRPAITHSLEFLFDKFRLPTGGFASRTSTSGNKIFGPIDLYDLSFCLFALAHAFKIINDNRLKEEAILLTSFIVNEFNHSSGGYMESLPPANPRRQNPHMHFLEALLEWRNISDECIFVNWRATRVF
jgi:mannose/cellobiose epimerase-like protein (N-acyl-D-glucosamine 2-epimerase family)